MTEHTAHIRTHVAAPPAPSKKECPFCGNNTVTAGYCSSCNTHFPTVKSTDSPQHLMQINPRQRNIDRPKRSVPQWYSPQHDGIDELQPDDDQADELVGLDLPDDQDFDPASQDDLLPSDNDLPW